MVTVKVKNAKDNVKSTRDVKRHLKSIRKLRNFEVIAMTYIQIYKNSFTKGISGNVIENASR
jgi:hypothetical protein